jgi:hypothetical protein
VNDRSEFEQALSFSSKASLVEAERFVKESLAGDYPHFTTETVRSLPVGLRHGETPL